jgi:GT2 family glycosyltransferase
MVACLTSLQALRYPAYEIVVVDDGSTDSTGRIADRYEGVHVVHQPNMGLSAARNVGMHASTGEIIAYTDSDCVVDPDWLHYLVATFLSSGVSAVGGPNLPPPEDSLVASCVAAAPGGPLPVLLNDREAEHVPGCNMAFWRGALEDVGGFDPIFRAAGDDVDICWRLERRGHLIGWSPAAMVWHFRRNTVRAYIGQQRGYGKAEALLYLRHPDRFNSLGYSRWRGRVYGGISAVLSWRRSVIYGGVFGRGLFQTLYQQPASSWAYLPFTLEWNAVAAILLVGALLHGGFAWLFATPLAVSWAGCVGGALRARVDARAGSARGRLLIALLTYLGPVLRSLERYRWWARGLTAAAAAPGHQEAASRLGWQDRAFTTSFWTADGLDKEAILDGLTTAITSRGHLVAVDQGWSQWDLEVHGGIWSRARVKVATEYHGGERRVLRVKCALRASPLARLIVIGAFAGIAAGALLAAKWLLAVGIGAAAFGMARYFLERLRVRRALDAALCAVKRNLRLHEVSAESP